MSTFSTNNTLELATADSHLSPKTTEQYIQLLADLRTNLGRKVCTTEGPEGIRICLLKKQLRRKCMQFQVTSERGTHQRIWCSSTDCWSEYHICNYGRQLLYLSSRTRLPRLLFVNKAISHVFKTVQHQVRGRTPNTTRLFRT